MKIVADESVDRQIVERLRAGGHSVVFIAELEPGISDQAVLARSREQEALLLTADKDFGELVFRQRLLHGGILLVRLAGLNPEEKAALVASAVERYSASLGLGFAVLTRRSFRVRRAL